MSPHSENLSYRVMRKGRDWYWELLDSDQSVVERGLAGSFAHARADAFAACSERIHSTPELWPFENPHSSEKTILIVNEQGVIISRVPVPISD
jgi:hypothetical protein